MFVYELIGLFLRSFNIAQSFILECCVFLSTNLLKPLLASLTPTRKERIYVTFTPDLAQNELQQNVKGENIDPESFSSGDAFVECVMWCGFIDEIESIDFGGFKILQFTDNFILYFSDKKLSM
jgi:hypothetical protein